MKALGLLIALHACLSSGDRWTRYTETYPQLNYMYSHHDINKNWEWINSPYNNEKLNYGAFSPSFLPPNKRPNFYNKVNAQVIAKQIYPVGSSNGNKYLEANAKQTEDVLNVFSKPVHENDASNEMLRNNGVQNNLSFTSKRAFGDDVDVKQDVKKVNNFIYFLNKTSDINPQPGHTYMPTLTANLPNQGNILQVSPDTRYLIQPRPSWNQQHIPLSPNTVHINPSPNGFYPVNSDQNNWNQPEPYQNECYEMLDVIRDLRVLLHKNNIAEEKQSVKRLFGIIRYFILTNNLQHASFSVIVREIGRVLLSGNDDRNTLRQNEMIQILQQFKNGDLNNFILEIRSSPEKSLRVVVSKLALLLYRLKQILIQRGFSQDNIKLVINRAVQWSVPLVAYYFEKECKIKTQRYIVQNLEVALNVKLESVQHVGSIGELQTDKNLSENVGGLTNSLISQELGNQENLGGLGSVGSLAGPLNPGIGHGYLGYHDGVGGMVNQVNLEAMENREDLGSYEVVGIQGHPGLSRVEKLIPLKQGA